MPCPVPDCSCKPARSRPGPYSLPTWHFERCSFPEATVRFLSTLTDEQAAAAKVVPYGADGCFYVFYPET
jgi:hypothetical protein